MKNKFLALTFLLLSVITFSVSAQSEPEHDSSTEVRLINGVNTVSIPKSKSSLRIIVRNGDIVQVVEQTESGKIIRGNIDEAEGKETRDDCGTCGKGKYIAFTWNDDSGNGGFGCKACKGKKSPNSSSNNTSEPLIIYFKSRR